MNNLGLLVKFVIKKKSYQLGKIILDFSLHHGISSTTVASAKDSKHSEILRDCKIHPINNIRAAIPLYDKRLFKL